MYNAVAAIHASAVFNLRPAFSRSARNREEMCTKARLGQMTSYWSMWSMSSLRRRSPHWLRRGQMYISSTVWNYTNVRSPLRCRS